MSPESRDDWAFLEAVEAFASAVAQRFAAPVDAQPEAQLTEPVGALLRACGATMEREVDWNPQPRAEGGIGWPDLGVTVGGLLCGYVELKAPDVDARPERFGGQNHEQWKRYRALPNLIYTNGSEWGLYRTGERACRVRIADNMRDGALPRPRHTVQTLRPAARVPALATGRAGRGARPRRIPRAHRPLPARRGARCAQAGEPRP